MYVLQYDQGVSGPFEDTEEARAYAAVLEKQSETGPKSWHIHPVKTPEWPLGLAPDAEKDWQLKVVDDAD